MNLYNALDVIFVISVVCDRLYFGKRICHQNMSLNVLDEC